MIHIVLNAKDRFQIRYTYHKLDYLKAVIAAGRSKMLILAMDQENSYLKSGFFAFFEETSGSEKEIKNQLESLSHVFPVRDFNQTIATPFDELYFTDPFECACLFEEETKKAFRILMNDNEIIPEVRNKLQNHLNEMMYAFLKIKLLRSFNFTELAVERILF